MLNEFSRTELIFGKTAMEKLANSRVAVFGIGGVGGYAVEALARSGIGALDLIDDDRICITNINRQILATHKTVGQYKVDAARKRVLEISPGISIQTYKCFYLPETAGQFDFLQYDYVIDAIDTVTGKLEIIMRAKESGVPVISCMGAGNKVDPTAFRVADISETSVCPLAKVMRHELNKRGISEVKVVYSREPVIRPTCDTSVSFCEGCVYPEDGTRKYIHRRDIPGSNAFVPSVAGLIIAGEVIKDLTTFDLSDRIK